MDLLSRKYKMVEKLMKVSDAETFYQIEKIFKSEIITKSNIEFPDIVKQLLKKSEEDILNGRTFTLEEVMTNIKVKSIISINSENNLVANSFSYFSTRSRLYS